MELRFDDLLTEALATQGHSQNKDRKVDQLLVANKAARMKLLEDKSMATAAVDARYLGPWPSCFGEMKHERADLRNEEGLGLDE